MAFQFKVRTLAFTMNELEATENSEHSDLHFNRCWVLCFCFPHGLSIFLIIIFVFYSFSVCPPPLECSKRSKDRNCLACLPILTLSPVPGTQEGKKGKEGRERTKEKKKGRKKCSLYKVLSSVSQHPAIQPLEVRE